MKGFCDLFLRHALLVHAACLLFDVFVVRLHLCSY